MKDRLNDFDNFDIRFRTKIGSACGKWIFHRIDFLRKNWMLIKHNYSLSCSDRLSLNVCYHVACWHVLYSYLFAFNSITNKGKSDGNVSDSIAIRFTIFNQSNGGHIVFIYYCWTRTGSIGRLARNVVSQKIDVPR